MASDRHEGQAEEGQAEEGRRVKGRSSGALRRARAFAHCSAVSGASCGVRIIAVQPTKTMDER